MISLAYMVVGHMVTAVVPEDVALSDHPQHHLLVVAAVPLSIVDVRKVELTNTNTKTVDKESSSST